jgi:hypothetical protein
VKNERQEICYSIHSLSSLFQVAAFSEWISCTQKYARKGLTASNVEDICEDKGFVFGFPPKCDHKALFFENEKPCSCHNPIIFPDNPILH